MGSEVFLDEGEEGIFKALDCMEHLELENPKEWSNGPSMKTAGRLSSAFSIDRNLFVVNKNGRLDTFDGQNWHKGKNPEGWPDSVDIDDDNVTITVKMTSPLKALIAEARQRRLGI